ncbi:hypothetical protein D3C78_1633150 [compost metagenome]
MRDRDECLVLQLGQVDTLSLGQSMIHRHCQQQPFSKQRHNLNTFALAQHWQAQQADIEASFDEFFQLRFRREFADIQ